MEADEYQHVKEPKTSDKLTLDNATEEQSKQIQHQNEDEHANNEEEDVEESNMELNEETEEIENNEDVQEMNAEKLEKKSDKPSKSEPRNENATTEEKLEVEGEIVETMTVARSDDTTAHCK